VSRARELLAEMEAAHASEKPVVAEERQQLSFGGASRESALEMLEKTNIDELTDSECRELLKDMAALLN
ncbi:MAG: hypothetical protein J6M07_00260, partial [Ruminococcus sp.]|nr:hypothetical protein [Ruminococcus sp.]